MPEWTDVPCRIWEGYIHGSGYGQRRVAGKLWYVHVFEYLTHVGPIPTGLELDHLCRNRACYEPRHLEPVTRQVNVDRGLGARRTHCKNGHPYDYRASVGRWTNPRCKRCHAALQRKYNMEAKRVTV